MPTREAGQTVLIVAPLGQDAPSMARLLESQGIASHICSGIEECAASIGPDVAALLLTEEALELPHVPRLIEALTDQPAWSELPLIVLTRGGEKRVATLLDLTQIAPGAVSVLERPMQTATLLQGVRVALRSRQRQYQVRDLLEQQQKNVDERAALARELEHSLAKRTLELTRTHEHLRRTEAAAVLGALAGGISHDLGNLLLPLRLRVEFLQKIHLPDEAKEHVDAIGRKVSYLQSLAQRLRQFMTGSEESSHHHEPVDLARWCGATAAFYRSILPERVHFKCDVPHHLPPVRLNEAGLTQAVYNLVQNASKAIEEAGVGERIVLRAVEVGDSGKDGQADQVRITVEDDGPGMPPEVLERCMDRSFTTGAGKGSLGLGLSLVTSFVNASGGSVHAQSPPPSRSRGTVFSMTFPTQQQQPPTGSAGAGVVTTKPALSAHVQSPRNRPQ